MTNTQSPAPGVAAEFQKRPVNITAIQWTGDNLDAVMAFCAGNATYELMFRDNSEIVIATLEDGADKVAKHVANKGDWIIRGIQGEFYPCKPDIFEATYQAPVSQGLDAWKEGYDVGRKGGLNAPDLHPATANLVLRFSDALRNKLADAEKKYGYTDGWLSPDWLDECREKLAEHVGKGDPRDVAAYCAFLWHHDSHTAPPLPAQVQAADNWLPDADGHNDDGAAEADGDAQMLDALLHYMRESDGITIGIPFELAHSIRLTLESSRTPTPGMAGGVGAEVMIANLRKAAQEIAQAEHAGWGNLCNDAADLLVSLTNAPVMAYRSSRNGGKTWMLSDYDPTELMPDHGGIVQQLVHLAAPHPSPAPQAAGADNPTNLPESLGETVHEALVGALQARGYRADGDNVALARRAHLMAMEDRDLINMQKALIEKLKPAAIEAGRAGS